MKYEWELVSLFQINLAFCSGAIKIYVNEVGFRAGWRVSRNPKYKICGVGIVHLCDEI